MKIIKCQRCGKEFEVEKATGVKFCKECVELQREETLKKFNEKKFQLKQKKLLEGVEGVDYIIDRWNGLAVKAITCSWINAHHPGKTVNDYKKAFPDAPIVCQKTSDKISSNTKEVMNTPEMKKIFSDRIKGNKNPNAKCNTTEEQRKSISPFSKSFKRYAEMSDEEKNKNIHKIFNPIEMIEQQIKLNIG